MGYGNYVLTVVDSSSGLPVPNVKVTYTYSSAPCAPFGDPNWFYGCQSGPGSSATLYTDANGQISVDIPYNAPGAIFTGTLDGNGYWTTPFSSGSLGIITGDVDETARIFSKSGGAPPPPGGGPWATLGQWWDRFWGGTQGQFQQDKYVLAAVVAVVAVALIIVFAFLLTR